MTQLIASHARAVAIVANAPAIFARHDFMGWLNDPGRRTFTWHDHGPEAGEYSDVVVLVDTHYEGDASDMPEDIWREICDMAYAEYGGIGLTGSGSHAVAVRLTNLEA